MPKEQLRSGEHRPSAASSKNAKDKSNSTTLLAMRNNNKNAEDSSGKGSRCSSEKDSGYSDGSDWQHTDAEDQRSNKSQSRGSERAETSQPGQNQEARPGNPALMPAGPPVYILNNVVLKQPDSIQRRDQPPRRNGSRDSSSSGAAHVILLQQPSLLPAPLWIHKPSSLKSSPTGKKVKGTYLPILNSYPRIAPHPSKKPPEKSSSNNESQNLSKRVCTEHKSEDAPVTRSLYKQPKLAVFTSGLPCSSSTGDSLSSSSPNTVSSGSSLATRGLHKNGTTNSRHRRFLNTAEILRQSGLLDITLRTKELLRQSNTTERDIAQLRQHTELLCRAASNPGCSPNGIAAWEQLHRAMAESGCYPDLKLLQNVQISRQPESISTSGPPSAENSEVPSPLTSLPHPNQNCPTPRQSHSGQGWELELGSKSLEKVLMSPDSSTG